MHGRWAPVMIALTILGAGWTAARSRAARRGTRTRALRRARSRSRFVVAGDVVWALKAAVGRVRPWIALGLPAPIGAPHDGSFPSGHAAGSFCVAAFLAVVLPVVWPDSRRFARTRLRLLGLALAACHRASRASTSAPTFRATCSPARSLGALVGRRCGRSVRTSRAADVSAIPSLGFAVRMHRALPGCRSLVLVRRARLVSGCASCGDLVIPKNSTDDGGAGDATTTPVRRATTSRRPRPNCDAGVEPVALACTGLYADWTQLTARSRRPGVRAGRDDVGRRRRLLAVDLAARRARRSTRRDPNGWQFPGRHQALAGAAAPRQAHRDALSLEGGAGPVVSRHLRVDRRPERRAGRSTARASPTRAACPTRFRAVSACEKCHDGAADFVLGFEAVGLAMPAIERLNLQALEQGRLLSKPRRAFPPVPGDPTTGAALAFLHANCGTSCHNRGPSAGAGATGLFLKLTVDAAGRAARDRAGRPTPGSRRTRSRAR